MKGIGLSVYPPGNLRMREELPLLANPSQLNSFFFTGMAWETYFHPQGRHNTGAQGQAAEALWRTLSGRRKATGRHGKGMAPGGKLKKILKIQWIAIDFFYSK